MKLLFLSPLGVTALLIGVLATLPSAASAQSVPQTLFGSITDESGPVDEGIPVEAYIESTLCGTGATEFTGDGNARVTAYAVDVFANGSASGEKQGCGRDGATVRIKIGDRFAPQTAVWRAGPMRLDVVFGERATPAPLPTFTPIPPTNTPGPDPSPTEADGTPDATTEATGTVTQQPPDGTPTPSVAASSTAVLTSTPSGTATLTGGVGTTGAGGNGGGDSGVPLWGVVVAILGAVALAGGGAGILMARARAKEEMIAGND